MGKYCCRPVPAYLEQVGGAEEEEGGGPLDIKYHLLRLYADRSHSLESLLSPASHTPDQLDTRLSWLLYQVCVHAERSCSYRSMAYETLCWLAITSVGNPDPDSQNPHAFGPPDPLVRGTDPDPDISLFLINVLSGLK